MPQHNNDINLFGTVLANNAITFFGLLQFFALVVEFELEVTIKTAAASSRVLEFLWSSTHRNSKFRIGGRMV